VFPVPLSELVNGTNMVSFAVPNSNDGYPPVVTSVDLLTLTNGSITVPPKPGFSIEPGYAQDIGIGANGAVWVTGTNPVAGGYGIYQWNGRTWIRQRAGQ
jgi:hypothetical protein